ncbi:ATP phosphoribosyltransferase regulatory subunit [Acidocella sp.]|uniref:ATP phosphoribosyltransferase regulatory subunit n=1 Tax=Acidocella sp. TaxID=50710 RepID=UPI00262C677F|nr:ATP phosphoribosyltransferase regulatory subunit [Acidocella sp.]
MNETPTSHPALLPAGLADVLPPEAERQARSAEAIMDCFAAHGYQRVTPPLLEFEESLFAGSGAATVEQTFRLMDPESQRMMGLRADTTPQIGRLATSRLATSPRPLRLAYCGPVLRVRGTHMQPERQLSQAGIELIGHDTAVADAEIILAAIAALEAVGLRDLSIDLTIPRLVPSLLDEVPSHLHPALAHALDRKDAAAVAEMGGVQTVLLLKLLDASGAAARAVPALLEAGLPEAGHAQAERLAEVVAAVQTVLPSLKLTVDPVEFRGYRYHTGISMTIFATGEQMELGRGGRYLCGDAEPATGITLYPDSIIRLAPPISLRPRLYLPYGTGQACAQKARVEGYATVLGLAPEASASDEARRLGCSHLLFDGVITALC